MYERYPNIAASLIGTYNDLTIFTKIVVIVTGVIDIYRDHFSYYSIETYVVRTC